MKRKIEVDGAVFEALQQRAAPFVDTPNSVLRRLLSLDSENTAAAPATQLSDEQSPPPSVATYRLESKGVVARAVRIGAKGMKVLTAESDLKEMASLSDSNREIRRRLLTDGTFEQIGAGQYRLTRPHEFSSPSAASSVLLGRESNGRLEWKDELGEPLERR